MQPLRRIVAATVAVPALLWAGLVVYAYWPGEPELPARQLATEEDRFLAVDGLELRYRTYGKPDPGKPNLVLVHGFANSLQTFRRLVPLLTQDFYVVAVDAPGFGLSAKPVAHDYSNAAQGMVIAHFAAALGLDRYVIGGHSMGGTLAVYIASSDPHVSGMVLMNPGIISTGVPPISQYLFFPMPRVMARMFGSRSFRENFLKRSFLDPEIVTEKVMDDMMLGPRSEGYLAGTTSMMGQYQTGDEPEVASKVRVPTLIAWGMQDRSKKPDELEQVRSLIPGSKVARVQDSGHYVQEERPAEVAAAMIDMVPDWLPKAAAGT
jgi:pimeloyl-ACP methyl ester carboxylesterase